MDRLKACGTVSGENWRQNLKEEVPYTVSAHKGAHKVGGLEVDSNMPIC